MSLTRKIAQHTLLYGFTQILIMGAGIISMPILTRVLSHADYGRMVVIGTTMSLTMMLFSGGLRSALLRFYGEYREQEGALPRAIRTDLTCLVLLAAAGAAVLTVVFPALVGVGVIPRAVLAAALLAIPIVFVRLAFEGLACLCRVREQVLRYNFYALATKYIGLGLVVFFLVTVAPTLVQYYRGLLVGEALILTVLAIAHVRELREARPGISRPVASEMFRYGVPMMLAGLATTVLLSGDRYVIQALLGPTYVATYSVACGLATYASVAIVAGFESALVPVVMNAWGKGDHDQAERALANLVRYYALAVFPAAVGIIATRHAVVGLLAPPKYASAAHVVPFLMTAALLRGFVTPLMIGLNFAKRTSVRAYLVGGAAVLNVILDLILIPFFRMTRFGGLMGAAVATLISIVCYIVVGHLFARRHYTLVIPWGCLVRYAASAFLMYEYVSLVYLPNGLAELGARISLGVLVYFTLVMLLDRPLRLYVYGRLAKLRRR